MRQPAEADGALTVTIATRRPCASRPIYPVAIAAIAVRLNGRMGHGRQGASRRDAAAARVEIAGFDIQFGVIERFFGPRGREFGEVGPKLLSDYIASDAGAELRERVFSPMFFNAIDWTEVDRFDKPISELADYLNDERVFH